MYVSLELTVLAKIFKLVWIIAYSIYKLIEQ